MNLVKVFLILLVILHINNIQCGTIIGKKSKKDKKKAAKEDNLNNSNLEQDQNLDQQEADFQYDIKTIIPKHLRKPIDYDYGSENIWRYDCSVDRDIYRKTMQYSQQENYMYAKKQGKKYYDYKNYVIKEYGKSNAYVYGKNIGSGHYADVYKSLEKANNDTVIIKNLKDIKVDKIKREYTILKKLGDHPHITKLIDVFPIQNSTEKENGRLDFNKLVFQQQDQDYEGEEYRQLNKTAKKNRIARAAYVFDFLTTNTVHKAEKYMMDNDIRCAIYDILKATAYTHSKGIMHRDIKPGNMVYHMTKKIGVLIDFGLADYFLYDRPYHYRVATKSYKAPELLLNFTCYDFGIDTWGIGLTMSQLVFRKRPMFNGRDDINVLRSIVKIHGTEKMIKFLEKYNVKVDTFTSEYFPTTLNGRNWDYYVNEDNQQNISEEAFDLLSKLLAFDFSDRISPQDALSHPYFDPIRDFKEGRNTTEVNFEDGFTEEMFTTLDDYDESSDLNEQELNEILNKKNKSSNSKQEGKNNDDNDENQFDDSIIEEIFSNQSGKNKNKNKPSKQGKKNPEDIKRAKEAFDLLNKSEQENLKLKWKNSIPYMPNMNNNKKDKKKDNKKSKRQQEYEEYINSKKKQQQDNNKEQKNDKKQQQKDDL